jgi:cytochrome subunit of sulfide dehydrogenase
MRRPKVWPPSSTVLWAAAILLVALGEAASAAARQPAALADACASCHGTDGRSQGAIPSLAGMPAQDFVARMAAFRAGGGGATIMDRIAPGFTPAEIERLADYFASLH